MGFTIRQAQVKTDYPVEEGLIAGTTKQTGRKMNLVAQEGSFVPQRQKKGIDYE